MPESVKKSTGGSAGVTRSLGYFLRGVWEIVAPDRLEALGVRRSLEPAETPSDPSDPQRHQQAQGHYSLDATRVSALWPSDPGHNGGTFFSPSKAATPGSFLADLSLHFAHHPDHHAILSRYCALANQYHQQHGLSISEAVTHAYSGTIVEFGNGGAAAMLRPEILDKLPRPLLPLERETGEARLRAVEQHISSRVGRRPRVSPAPILFNQHDHDVKAEANGGQGDG